MGLPDPPDHDSHDSSVSSNNDIIMVHSDTEDFNDFESNDNPYEGYQQLPLNATDDYQSIANDSDSNDDEMETGVEQSTEPTTDISPILSSEKVLLKEVWGQTQSKDIEMDSDKVKAVKDAMVNFTLPSSSIPEWANHIPEQDWKDHILKKLQAPK